MSLINSIINYSISHEYKRAAELVAKPAGTLRVSDYGRILVDFVDQVKNVPRQHFIDSTVKEAIDKMPEKPFNQEWWPFVTPPQPTWYEWRVDNGRMGALLKPLSGQRGYSLQFALQGVGMPKGAFNLLPEFICGEKQVSQAGGAQMLNMNAYTYAPREDIVLQNRKNTGMMVSLMLLLNSEASPVVVRAATEDFGVLNKKRAKNDKPPLRPLAPIVIDLSKLGARKEQIDQAQGDDSAIKRICVEHIVSSHFKTYHNPKTGESKLLFIDEYVRYEGSPKGSTVDLPRRVHITRSNPNSTHKLRGPQGENLM